MICVTLFYTFVWIILPPLSSIDSEFLHVLDFLWYETWYET